MIAVPEQSGRALVRQVVGSDRHGSELLRELRVGSLPAVVCLREGALVSRVVGEDGLRQFVGMGEVGAAVLRAWLINCGLLRAAGGGSGQDAQGVGRGGRGRNGEDDDEYRDGDGGGGGGGGGEEEEEEWRGRGSQSRLLVTARWVVTPPCSCANLPHLSFCNPAARRLHCAATGLASLTVDSIPNSPRRSHTSISSLLSFPRHPSSPLLRSPSLPSPASPPLLSPLPAGQCLVMLTRVGRGPPFL